MIDDILVLDFDDTIFSRDHEDQDISIQNCLMLNKLAKYIDCVVLSGNGYDNISQSLSRVGINLTVPIWADCGLIKYITNNAVEFIDGFNIQHKDEIQALINDIFQSVEVQFRGTDDYLSCISIKPIKTYRQLSVDMLNSRLKELNLQYTAKPAGRTSIDIMVSNVNKLSTFERIIKDKKAFYIGDEMFSGNDKVIYDKYEHMCLPVKDVKCTNHLLKTFLEFFNTAGISEVQ